MTDESIVWWFVLYAKFLIVSSLVWGVVLAYRGAKEFPPKGIYDWTCSIVINFFGGIAFVVLYSIGLTAVIAGIAFVVLAWP